MTSERYSYDKRAELLTKSWLMGVRRGWLSLMKPSIRDWNGVFRAIDALEDFVTNLQEQVAFVRRAPLSDAGKTKLSGLFTTLKSEIKDKQSTAKHWMQVHTGTTGMPAGTFTVEEAEKMLDLYRNKFDEVMTYWQGRERPLTDLLDKILAILRQEAVLLKKHIDTEHDQGSRETEREWSEAVFREFSYGRMKVIVQDMKANGNLVRAYVRFIDKAYQLLRRRGFEKLWYGVMFIESVDYDKLNKSQIAAYEALGYKGLRSRAGRYHAGEDIFVLTQPPGQWVAESIVHELGHRYWSKFMKGSQRARFESLVKVNRAPQDELQPIPERVVSSLQDSVHEARQRVDRGMELVKKDDRFYDPKGIQYAFDEAYSRLNGGLQALKILILDPVELRAYIKPEADPWIRQTLGRAVAQIKLLEERIRTLNAFVSSFSGEVEADPDHFRRRFDMWKRDWLMGMDATLMGTEGLAYEVVQAFETAQRDRIEKEDKNDPRTVLPVSGYGKSHIQEAFAEAYTWYVYGRDMSRDQIESFRSVLKNASLAPLVVSRYLHGAYGQQRQHSA